MTGSSQPNDIELGQSFAYDRRNRLDSWTKQGTTHDFGYDELGNLTNHAGSAQVFSDPSRPHALQSRAGGAATYSHDADGNVTSIASPGGARYFQFDSASRMVCADTVEGGCALNRLHYDVDGRRVLDDHPMSMKFAAFVEDSVSVDGGLYTETRIEIRAFGERIAYKRSGDDFRTAGGLGAVPWGVPPEALGLLAGLAVAGLFAWSAKQGALVLVLQRPGYAGVSAVLVVVLVLGPFPGVPVSRAGGGGEANFYWELSDPLGTGMVMLDETGARRVHRTYSPFGAQTASAGPGNWLPRHYAGHLADEDSGLVYMQARWMDPESGTFLSIDPLVPDAGDPQAFNAYAYARNNPRSFTDPTGASASWEWQLPIDSGWFVYTGIEGGIQQFTLILYGLGEAFTPGDSSGGGWGGLSSLGLGDMGGSGYGGGLNSAGGSGGSGRASHGTPAPDSIAVREGSITEQQGGDRFYAELRAEEYRIGARNLIFTLEQLPELVKGLENAAKIPKAFSRTGPIWRGVGVVLGAAVGSYYTKQITDNLIYQNGLRPDYGLPRIDSFSAGLTLGGFGPGGDLSRLRGEIAHLRRVAGLAGP